MRVVIVGQGYVGLPVAMRAVEVGHDVVGFDIDEERVKALSAGESYVDDVTNERVAAAVATGRYRPTTLAEHCIDFDIAVISVPTPLAEGVPDLRHIEQAAEMLAPWLRAGACVVLESTTYPGTTEELVAPILEKGSGLLAGVDFQLGYSPERIDPGSAQWTFERIPKVVSGIDEASLATVQAFYDTLVEQTVAVTSTRVAEMVKLLENTFRHVNVALMNELAMYAGDLDVDIWEAIDAASTKPFGYLRFTPGPGAGGHCLPVDPSYLSWQVRRRLGHAFRFVELANDVNQHMPDYVVRRIIASLNRAGKPVKGTRLLLLGLAYKRNTGDARESPAAAVAEHLATLEADVRVADPHVREHALDHRVARVDATEDEIAAADLIIVLTDHDAFDFDLVGRVGQSVFDTRNRVSGANVERL
jgi:UDP-N-acetyl-D-glucosamine dehydrogenase